MALLYNQRPDNAQSTSKISGWNASLSGTGLKFESWKVKNHTQNKSQHLCLCVCFLKDVSILKFGCSLKSPTEAQVTRSKTKMWFKVQDTGPVNGKHHQDQTANQKRVYVDIYTFHSFTAHKHLSQACAQVRLCGLKKYKRFLCQTPSTLIIRVRPKRWHHNQRQAAHHLLLIRYFTFRS